MKKVLDSRPSALQMSVNTILIGVDPYFLEFGDNGWNIFCEKFLSLEKTMNGHPDVWESLQLAALDPEKQPGDAEYLMKEYIRRVVNKQEIPEGLEIWVANGLLGLLQNKTARMAFEIKSQPGPKVEFAKRLKMACYFKYLRNTEESYEDASAKCGEKWGTDPRNAAKLAHSILIPDVSNTTLETISRINLRPIF